MFVSLFVVVVVVVVVVFVCGFCYYRFFFSFTYISMQESHQRLQSVSRKTCQAPRQFLDNLPLASSLCCTSILDLYFPRLFPKRFTDSIQ